MHSIRKEIHNQVGLFLTIGEELIDLGTSSFSVMSVYSSATSGKTVHGEVKTRHWLESSLILQLLYSCS